MFSVKKSVIALVGIMVLAGAMSGLVPLVGHGQGGKPSTRDARRLFYITRTGFNGSQALTACAQGYHMASFWEIFDVSNLKYNTELGRISGDSGFGPPSSVQGLGWIRNGDFANTGAGPSPSNCDAWTSANAADTGTSANLSFGDLSNPVRVGAPWVVQEISCEFPISVWCMQD